MDFVKFSLAGFDEFLVYAGLSVVFVYAYMLIYLRLTPYDELKLIKEGNVAAALSLSGTVLGFGALDGGVDTDTSCVFSATFTADESAAFQRSAAAVKELVDLL